MSKNKENIKEEIKQKILIVDDEKNMRESLSHYLESEGYHTVCAGSGSEALKIIEIQLFHAVILDLKMPNLDGLECIKIIRGNGNKVPILMMSAHGDIHDAVAAMKLGANDYLVKPFNPQELLIRLSSIIDKSHLEKLVTVDKRLSENKLFKKNIHKSSSFFLASKNEEMQGIAQLIERVAPTLATVLITGETGTGKEVLAKEIHRKSNRSEGPFIPINIGAVPEALLESELFGYEKGAFTGAIDRKIGLFELASGGTLFLDEIGEMALQTQVKLLRVLQERIIMRLGSTKQIPIDVRIISATNKDLEQKILEELFREDLFYRLNVISIEIPPLRNRKEDIIPLAMHFLDVFYCREKVNMAIFSLSDKAIQTLQAYTYPGNVRELENIIERAIILSDGNIIKEKDLSINFNKSLGLDNQSSSCETKTSSFVHNMIQDKKGDMNLEHIEKHAILAVLDRNNWHRERTANELGITRRTLLNKIREYQLKQDV